MTFKKIRPAKSTPEKKWSGPDGFLGNIQNSQQRDQHILTQTLSELRKKKFACGKGNYCSANTSFSPVHLTGAGFNLMAAFTVDRSDAVSVLSLVLKNQCFCSALKELPNSSVR